MSLGACNENGPKYEPKKNTENNDRFSNEFLYPWALLFSGSGAHVLTAKRSQPLFDERIAVLMLSINRAEPGNARLPLGRSRLALHVAHTSDHPTLLCSSVTFTCTHACIAYWPQGTGAGNFSLPRTSQTGAQWLSLDACE